MRVDAYPLQWPAGWRRTAEADRIRARFSKKERKSYTVGFNNEQRSYLQSARLSIADAVKRVRQALERFGFNDDDIVISTNLELRLDGLPRSGQREPADPGVAVYWRDGSAAKAMAVDLYDRVADNLAAVAATIDAMRAIERHGGAQILDRAFAGFKALPSESTPTMTAGAAAGVLAAYGDAPPSNILNSFEGFRSALRVARAKAHPDTGAPRHAWDHIEAAKAVLEQHHGRTL